MLIRYFFIGRATGLCCSTELDAIPPRQSTLGFVARNCVYSNFLLAKPLLGTLLGLVGDIRVVESSLEAASDVVGVLLSVVAADSVGITTVLDLLEDLLGVLLGFV